MKHRRGSIALLWLAALAIGALTALTTSALTPQTAHAFCGTYLSDDNTPLYNDATQVVLMREGTTTVLSMANTYEGPVKDFAMVVPVPVVLQQDNVKTLSKAVFETLDKQTSPRLVAYKEADPCAFNNANNDWNVNNSNVADQGTYLDFSTGADMGQAPPVVIEAQFSVGEYDILVLSAQDSTGLQTWLGQNNYKIPQEAGPVLQSYIQQGMYFFVAKINAAKVQYDQGRALLSPLRFHYTSTDFSLPVRLGMVNSKGEQDLIIHIISDESRYNVSNYPNEVIPTNLAVKAEVRQGFAAFYEGLFAQTIKEKPGAVVTEYAWQLSGCDPCPGPVISPQDLASLGGDVLYGPTQVDQAYFQSVVTRLHARYSKDTLKQDLIFKQVSGLIGGVGGAGAQRTKTTEDVSHNQFQGRYIIHYPWTGELTCERPQRELWGAYDGVESSPSVATRGVSLSDRETPAVALDELIVKDEDLFKSNTMGQPTPENPENPVDPENPENPAQPSPAGTPQTDGCAQSSGGAPLNLWSALLAGLGVWTLRRRKRH